MRILLIAYEFPPSPSPQSLRWMQLARHLVASGVDVHVLSVDATVEPGSPVLPVGVVVHRAFAGVVTGGLARLTRWRHGRRRVRTDPGSGGSDAADVAAVQAIVPPPEHPRTLNWKGRAEAWLKAHVARLYFPDERGEWEYFARRRLKALLTALRPDVVVSSHEPATTLRLGRTAKQAGFAWVADLGDPVLAFYTPRRWRAAAEEIERWVCRHADHVTVTTESARTLLLERHAIPGSRVSVLTQGFDAGQPRPGLPSPAVASGFDFDRTRLELVYTGSFYEFRQPHALLEAMLTCPGVRLTVATRSPPDWMLEYARAHPGQLRMAGFLSHQQSQELQRAGHVLVNIANTDAVHVPGKLFEYLGARRPVLQISDDWNDAASALIRQQRRGLVCRNEVGSIHEALLRLQDVQRENSWETHFRLGTEGLEHYEWAHIAGRLERILADVARGRPQAR
ncbi:glycosyltransferase [Luteimonas sp. R10]|uniref:glycosyltransferase n=1 Tax=Luteimonas sp. R10 TaxID=3108176 RepID=UPI003093D056|nr:glycosyltransferase [Luteimonas sp. R10]